MAMITYPYVHLDRIPTDRVVMKLLPQEIAYRHHALPVAMDGNQITVAMASPGDTDAINAVRSIIDAPICLIQADPKEIDKKLTDIWFKKLKANINIVDWSLTTPTDKAQQVYVESFAKLVTANLHCGDSTRWSYRSFSDLTDFSRKSFPDLHIFPKNNLKPLYQIRRYSSFLNGIGRFPDSLVIPIKPIWILKKILLILPDCINMSESAINWTLLIGELSQAEVTVLPLVSSVPPLDDEFMNYYSEDLLAQEGSLGNNMRMISSELSENKIKGSFKIQTGEPVDQIQKEIHSSGPDLVILSKSPQRSVWGHLACELMSFLLNRFDCPVLFSRD